MSKLVLALSFASALLLAACETPQAETQVAAATQTPANGGATEAEDGDEMICTTETVTGSRMGRRVCMTRSERERVREANRQAADELLNAPTAGPDNQSGQYRNPLDPN